MGCIVPKKQAVNWTDDEVNTLHSQIRWMKSWESIKLILDKKKPNSADKSLWFINAKDCKTGNSALMLAAQNGRAEICTKLLVNGADVRLKNNTGQSALHMTREYGYYWTSEVLLRYGADRKQKNKDGFWAENGISGQKISKIEKELSALLDATSIQQVETAAKMLELSSNLKCCDIDPADAAKGLIDIQKKELFKMVAPKTQESLRVSIKKIMSIPKYNGLKVWPPVAMI